LPTISGLGGSDVDLEKFDDLRKKDGARHDDQVVPDAIPVQHEVNIIPPINNTCVHKTKWIKWLRISWEIIGSRSHTEEVISLVAWLCHLYNMEI